MDKVGSGATTNVIASEGKKFKSIILLERSDPHRYSELNADLEKDQHFGDDHYHVTPSATFDLFVHRFGYFQQRGRVVEVADAAAAVEVAAVAAAEEFD